MEFLAPVSSRGKGASNEQPSRRLSWLPGSGGAEENASFNENASFQRVLGARSSVLGELEELDDAAVAEADMDRLQAEREMKEIRAQFLQVNAGQFLLFTVLVALVTAACRFSRYGENDYYLGEMVREAVISSEIHPTSAVAATTFENITSLEDIYAFMHGPLLTTLFVRTSHAGTPLPPERVHRVNEHNILIGSVRLQQVRGLHGMCTAALRPNETSACEADWLPTPDVDDTSPIIGASPALTNPACTPEGASAGTAACRPNEYVWSDATSSGIGSFAGWHSSYDGSGYVVHLPSGLAASRARLHTLRTDAFLGPRTRAVWMDFALYNVNVNRFCQVRLLFERLSSGTLVPSSTVRSYDLLWYDKGVGVPQIRLNVEISLLVLVLIFVGLELRAMRLVGMRAYWRDPTNYYDWPSLLGFGLIAFLRYRAWSAMSDVKASFGEWRDDAWIATNATSTIDGVVNLQGVVWWVEQEQAVLAIDALLMYLKLLHFLASVPYINNLLNTLVRARIQLLCFVSVLSVLVIAFASAFHLALGTQLGAWRGVGHSALSLLRFILGDVDYKSMYMANPALSTLLYLMFFFLVVLVGVNIFLAIIADAFSAERKQQTEVDLVKVLANAARRQIIRTRAARRRFKRRVTAPIRWIRHAILKTSAEAEAADAEAAEDAAQAEDAARLAAAARDARLVHTNAGGDGGEGGSPESSFIKGPDGTFIKKPPTEKERTEEALGHIERAKDALMGGHMYVLNDVRTQLKSLCFRQDGQHTSSAKLRQPLQLALAELEKHAALNDLLRQKARSEGWLWDLGTGELLHASAKGAPTEGGEGLVGAAARDDVSANAIACARRLARGEASNAPSAAAGAGGDADPPPEEDDPNGFSLQRAIAFTRALMVDEEMDAEKDAAKGKKHRHKHKHPHGKLV